jgi:hypothetical protein
MHLLANMGVPMIAIYWPPAWLAFIPVVAIESWWARRVLGNGWRKAITSTLIANAVSTLVGIPLVWCMWAAVQLRFFGNALGLENPARHVYAVTVQAAWLVPYEQDLWWMLPAASVVLTAVFFVGSVLVEGFIMKRMQRGADVRAVRAWAWKAHLCSYALILAVVVTFLYVPRADLDRIARAPVEFVFTAALRAASWLMPPPARG